MTVPASSGLEVGEVDIKLINAWGWESVLLSGYEYLPLPIEAVSIGYSPSSPTSGSVTATLTLSMSGTVTTPGRNPVVDDVWESVFTANAGPFNVEFDNRYGLT